MNDIASMVVLAAWIDSGAGDDLLVGGMSQDRIVGNADDAILFAGISILEANRAALTANMFEWTRTDADFTTRFDHFRNDSGANEAFLLNEVTVGDDGAADVLTGSEGQDWFLFTSSSNSGDSDKITDVKAFEALFAEDVLFLNGV